MKKPAEFKLSYLGNDLSEKKTSPTDTQPSIEKVTPPNPYLFFSSSKN